MKRAGSRGTFGVIGKYAGFAAAAVRQRGLTGALRDVVSEFWFDRCHGLRTTLPSEVRAREAGYSQQVEADAVQYQGVPPRIASAILSRLPESAFRATFVDFGCGKGRGLALGLVAGFRRVLGIELLPSLVEIAERNLCGLRLEYPGCEVRVEAGDATEFELPTGALVAFLYNPFRGETLKRVALRLRYHAAAYPVWIVYVNPVELTTFTAQGFTVEREHRRGGRVEAVLLVPSPMDSVPATSMPISSRRRPAR